MIQIPERYSYCEAYLTLRCNYHCPYCINEHSGVKRSRKELTAREWIIGLNNLNTHGLPITLGGGEPTIHPGFYDIVNGLKSKTHIDVLSNGSFNVQEFMRKTPKTRFQKRSFEYKPIRFSYHPKITVPVDIIEKAKVLSNYGYSTGIFGLNHPDNLEKNIKMVELCRQSGVFFFIRDYLGYYNDRLFGFYKYPSALNGNRRTVRCKNEELLIGPEGNIYRCHRDLYEGVGEIGNILNMAYEHKDEFRICNNYGSCNLCDCKIKMSSDLKTSKCSIEVEEIQ